MTSTRSAPASTRLWSRTCTRLRSTSTIGATLGCVWLLRTRAAVLLLVVELVQAAIGLTQYHLGLPIVLVGLHLLGAALAVAAATNLMLSVRPPADPAASSTEPVGVETDPKGRRWTSQEALRTGCASGHGIAHAGPGGGPPPDALRVSATHLETGNTPPLGRRSACLAARAGKRTR